MTPGAKIFDQYVGGFNDAKCNFFSLRSLQIECDASLRAIESQKRQALLLHKGVTDGPAARPFPATRLDFHDVRTQVSQELRRTGSLHELTEVRDTQSLKRSRHSYSSS